MLELSGIEVARAGFPVLQDIDLEAPEGAVTVLLGANGVGKTSLLEMISGVIPAAKGHVRLGGNDITKASRRSRALARLAHVEQNRTIFTGMTVEENLAAAAKPGDVPYAFELFPELKECANRRAELCSGGQQQMLVIARALVRRPTMVMIDELSLGLAPVIVKRLMRVVRDLADSGVGVLLVEQYAHQALSIGDRAYVLSRGRVAFSGTAKTLIDNPQELRTAYLGVAGS